jgi:hypothetical protein
LSSSSRSASSTGAAFKSRSNGTIRSMWCEARRPGWAGNCVGIARHDKIWGFSEAADGQKQICLGGTNGGSSPAHSSR